MANLLASQNFTDVSSIPRAILALTVPGMAHFAGTGPTGTFCSQCKFWKIEGKKKVEGCVKFSEMTGSMARKVPAKTPSCRHFQPK